MSDAALYANIGTLPEDLKAQVADFVAFLQQKRNTNPTLEKRQIGGLKGTFVMAANFNEPMDEFKDYM